MIIKLMWGPHVSFRTSCDVKRDKHAEAHKKKCERAKKTFARINFEYENYARVHAFLRKRSYR